MFDTVLEMSGRVPPLSNYVLPTRRRPIGHATLLTSVLRGPR